MLPPFIQTLLKYNFFLRKEQVCPYEKEVKILALTLKVCIIESKVKVSQYKFDLLTKKNDSERS